ncbi:AraC family transcriptional regulator ligand-binding domain-containing protein [Pseudomonas sp. Pseusp122]|uniref:AraC family transcriptional regulator n=1 Tax=unclassified Pseudomonas TaxID=196821 RepID=UPI0039A4ACE9
MPTIINSCLQSICEALMENGIDISRLPGYGRDWDLNGAGDQRVDLKVVYALLAAAASQCNRQDIGLLAYNHAHPGNLNTHGYAIMSSATLGQALDRFARYHPLTTDGSRIFIRRSRGMVKVMAYEMSVSPTESRYLIDAGMAMLLGLIHWLVPGKKLVPVGAEFSYAKPTDLTGLNELFGYNLSFSSPYNSVMFAAEVDNFSVFTANALLSTIHCQHCDALLQELEDKSIILDVKRVLVEGLMKGELLTLAEVAAVLHVSARSVQNHLLMASTNFSMLQESCRRELANYLLCHTHKSFKYISATLGYRDPSSFHKACQRWFGKTPGAFRESAAAES